MTSKRTICWRNYPDTSSSRVEEALAAARRQQEAVTRAQANIDSAWQQQRVAKLELDNARKLLAGQLVSRSEVTKSQTDYERAIADMKVAEAARDMFLAASVQTPARR
ncbi:hypothetical protein [Neisseria iguanae]|uniref:hypothetical protein n=1 Tax=Neisseria iguanae TaxID=90242 RepID=UPI0031831650